MIRTYIFGYGSLINLESLAKTINRNINVEQIIPVKLFGYRRVWNLVEVVHSDLVNKPVKAVFLNIQSDIKAVTNGILFEVTDGELRDLSIRERKYEKKEVSKIIMPYDAFALEKGNVFTFIATNRNHLQETISKDYFAMENYIKIVEQGCYDICPEFLEDYVRNTGPNPFPILSGTYKFI
jgi:cation transport regulator ChaC